MFELYIANKNYSSWSLRPWVLMKALEIPFNEHLMPFEGGFGASHEAFRRFSPSGLVPCLVDGELAVWDSLAIVEYLAEQHTNVWPADKAARAWARSATAEMHSGFGALRDECSMNCGLRVELNGLSDKLKADVYRLDALWQQGLERFGGPFLAGKYFSAVDAFYAPVAFRAQTFNLPLSAPSQAYVERLLALPAMQAWYQAALEEPWREPMHEAETLKNGTLKADLRLS
ncbi:MULTISPECIES: glutathione S-transferase family protein [unclassified Halomonas]|jgi:glutathione S-transferase|uniref:glutathione S-transferase family protein n=1 Tax=unclassified Halomonas TaxID=2609666 RepID=UPI0018EFA22A|nr:MULTISPECIES: glutathione S-transferase family protein [unclassified Halomonas]MCO7245773.1 glutathione S-transferase family protein [Halomonas sp. Mc5H-6]QPL45161.1 glutathione S-transferase family protein [Halomonas sp. A40-4]